MVSSSPVVGRRIGRRFRDRIFAHFVGGGDFRRANQGGRGRARTDGDHHVIGGVKVQGVYGTLMVAEEATGHHRPDALMVQDNHRERLCFAPDFMRPPGLDSSSPVSSSPGDAKRKKIGPFWIQCERAGKGATNAVRGDSTTTQSSCYIARLRVYILTVCLASRVGQTKCRTRLGPRALRGGPIAPGLVHSLNVSSPVVRSRGSLYLSSFFLPTR